MKSVLPVVGHDPTAADNGRVRRQASRDLDGMGQEQVLGRHAANGDDVRLELRNRLAHMALQDGRGRVIAGIVAGIYAIHFVPRSLHHAGNICRALRGHVERQAGIGIICLRCYH